MQSTIFPCKQGVYQETTPFNKSLTVIFFFVSVHICIRMATNQNLYTHQVWELVRVNAHLLALARLLRRDMVQQAAKVKIYTEQLQLQKLTLDDMGCMINHGGQGALDSRTRKTLWTGLKGGWANQERSYTSMQFRKQIIFWSFTP